ncbi:MAG: CehA/McbA family metallohydrolase [Pirellulaceae bacterium]|nr:CehA/McbA family metallohydrolase [Pirellulaceae bacterium]
MFVGLLSFSIFMEVGQDLEGAASDYVCPKGDHGEYSGRPHLADGELEFRVIDEETGDEISARLHIKDERGRAVRPPKSKYHGDHLLIDGMFVLRLPAGRYTFLLEKGPEYNYRQGVFVLKNRATDNKTLSLKRIVDMKEEGWYSGDLMVFREEEEVPLAAAAEGVAMSFLLPPQAKKRGRIKKKVKSDAEDVIGRVESILSGNAFTLKGKIVETKEHRLSEFRWKVSEKEEASQDELAQHTDLTRPYSWDLPLLLARGEVDSVQLLGEQLQREKVVTTEKEGRKRDKKKYPGDSGNARWNLAIYFHMLNCGFRIPPSAGSGSGLVENPVGYNRVYVYCGEKFDPAKWMENFREGQVLITNGPLLRPYINGKLPGHIFQVDQGEKLKMEISLELATREPIDYLEIIVNGVVQEEIRIDELQKSQGRLPEVIFEESGWLVVRAVTQSPQSYRYTMTAPYYVEVGGASLCRKESVEFFLNWLDDYERMSKTKVDSERAFWEGLLENAK